MRIVLDAMGGDFGPEPNVRGALRALEISPDLNLVLAGDENQINPLLQQLGNPHPVERLKVYHAPDVIGMNEKPVEAHRRKPNNSIAVCWGYIQMGRADGVVSAGNTGAVVGGGLLSRRFLKGVHRPGIAALMPTAKGRTVIVDVGANVFPKPSHLLQYGVMGAVYAKTTLGIENPTIGLMNVGEEEGKGHDLVNKTYELFRNSTLAGQFIGNVEGRDIHRGACDVIVTDGFVGNVILKQAEGAFELMVELIKKNLIGSLNSEKAIAAAALEKMVGELHHSNAGGAPLLGIDGICIICHGSSNETSITNALGVAAQACRDQLNQKISAAIAALPPEE
ncbi:MAG: phosphate acyltransferase PlsX [Fimbriiglobus sp.]